MTLEEAIKHCKEKACGNTECANEHKQLAEWLKELQQMKSLPSNLDEAAEEYEHNLGYYECMNQWPSVAFKAGAEWMAEQGVKLHGRILPGTCGNLYIESDWFDRGFGGLNYKFSDSNDVDMFVQIRKK